MPELPELPELPPVLGAPEMHLTLERQLRIFPAIHAATSSWASSFALGLGATILAHAGDSAKAIDYAERALRLTPFSRDSGDGQSRVSSSQSGTPGYPWGSSEPSTIGSVAAW